MKTKKKSLQKPNPKKLMRVMHGIERNLRKIDAIEALTMRKFDVKSLPEVKELSSIQIKKIRMREKVSQPFFARCLNISPTTVKKWEQGKNKPNGISLKVLNVIAKKGLSVFL
jgi:putative transcriptional regulator